MNATIICDLKLHSLLMKIVTNLQNIEAKFKTNLIMHEAAL